MWFVESATTVISTSSLDPDVRVILLYQVNTVEGFGRDCACLFGFWSKHLTFVLGRLTSDGKFVDLTEYFRTCGEHRTNRTGWFLLEYKEGFLA